MGRSGGDWAGRIRLPRIYLGVLRRSCMASFCPFSDVHSDYQDGS